MLRNAHQRFALLCLSVARWVLRLASAQMGVAFAGQAGYPMRPGTRDSFTVSRVRLPRVSQVAGQGERDRLDWERHRREQG